jgi:hypothetical protein
MDLKEIQREGVNCINMAQKNDQLRALAYEGADKSLALKRKQQATRLKKIYLLYIFSLSSTHL